MSFTIKACRTRSYAYLKLHDHVVEFVVSSAANELTDVVFTWREKEKGVNHTAKYYKSTPEGL